MVLKTFLVWIIDPLVMVLHALSTMWLSLGPLHRVIRPLLFPLKLFLFCMRIVLSVQLVYIVLMALHTTAKLVFIYACTMIDYVEQHPNTNTFSALLLKLSWPTIR